MIINHSFVKNLQTKNILKKSRYNNYMEKLLNKNEYIMNNNEYAKKYNFDKNLRYKFKIFQI